MELGSDLKLSAREIEVIERVYTRKEVDLDQSAKYVGWYLQMKIIGTLPFRIMHSHHTWLRARKLFKEFGIDLAKDLPETTSKSPRVRAYHLFMKNYPVVTPLWAALARVKRRDGTMRENRVFFDSVISPDA